jgi:hypothetical protein
MVDGESPFEEMYIRICEENGPADPALQGIVSEIYLLADLDKAERWAWLLTIYARTYVIVTHISIGKKAVAKAYHVAVLARLKAKSTKHFCTKKRSFDE